MTDKRRIRSVFLVVGAVITLLLSRFFGQGSTFVEQFYYRGIYQLFRTVYDYTLGFLPFPMIYVFILIILYVLYVIIRTLFSQKETIVNRLKSTCYVFLQTISALLIIFYWFWGFNYNRVSIESHLDMNYADMDTTDLLQVYAETSDRLVEIRRQFSLEEKMKSIESQPSLYENQCRQSLTNALDQMDYPTNGRVRIRRIRPQGSLLRISTAGVYWPFVFEGHIDPGLHPMTWPFTMSHEMGHGYGFTDEGTCNFLGWLACTTHEDPFIQYSGWIGYYRYLLTNLRRSISSQHYKEIYGSIPKVIVDDLAEIRKYAMRYPDIMPAVRDVVYDNYLKTHGVKGGLVNYSKIIKLVYAWEKEDLIQNQN